jgi:hypothetical protein
MQGAEGMREPSGVRIVVNPGSAPCPATLFGRLMPRLHWGRGASLAWRALRRAGQGARVGTRVAVDTGLLTDVAVYVEGDAMIVYKLWLRAPGGRWHTVGPEDTDSSRTDHWLFATPLANGTEFAYSVAAYGDPGQPWRIVMKLRQRARHEPWNDWIECGSWVDGGLIDRDCCGGHRTLLGDSARMQLFKLCAQDMSNGRSDV